jgi:hypothetical protein
MPELLSKLFGSAARVKLLRLFLFNPDATYDVGEAASRARVPSGEVSRELAQFAKIKLLIGSRGKNPHYTLNPEFPYIAPLQTLLLDASARADDVYKRLQHIGILKLIVVAGIFVGDFEGRIDLLIVADRIREDRLSKNIRILESEIGRDIRYGLLSTQEFFYRLNMNDHLVRDVLDYKHRIIFDKLDIGLE